MEYTFKQDDLVYFNYQGIQGYGLIKGVATTPMAVLGALYIVDTETEFVFDDKTYPFSAVAIPEIHLRKV